MKKQPQQPNRDEWLLDPMHGLTEGEEENIQQIFPSDFLTNEAFEYFAAIVKKRPTYHFERKIRRLISRSIWPRLLISRLRLLTATGIYLFLDGHWEFLDHILSFIKSALYYLGLVVHGLRLMMSTTHLIGIIISSDSASEEVFQYLGHSWFELFTDFQCIISALTPADYLFLSFGLMVLELLLIAIRAWNEEQKLIHHIKKISLAMSKQELHPEQLNELKQAKKHAETMLLHNYKKLALNFGVTLLTTSLFAIKSILLPCVMVSASANPLIPFIFAVIALSITIANHYLNQYLDKNKPKSNKLSGKYFFASNQNTFFSINETVHVQNEIEPELGAC
ncbi:hypothetical protein [Legionella londiniensis]|uniref:Coiled-coil protein n=1 Tax=Legionella londiniensis TaxID=45068 RepID=A0A0W0VJ42_9GAMM|nr:hypothetical protein [Legionella londiniensis]KTD20132.1 hypothetical protein Llon_1753 [Legionella londiniensis]STX94299.1 Uncharacterised protein [Legionella londiniensis]